ncbi:MAG: shikimate dehydrogenase [Alphaproteobacteria bacterium]|nr:shikimate dehydrogenase [Alphaproteobacteria bacterium]
MTTAKTRYGVAGWPVEHSRSPELHNFWLEETGIAEHYGKFAVAPGTFAEFLRETASGALLGLNITVPHKEEAARLCASRSQTARRCGAVNTLVFGDDSWHGENTDAGGLLSVWRELAAENGGVSPDTEAADSLAVILGAGGMARATLAALAESKTTRAAVVARTRARGETLARDFAGANLTISVHDWTERDTVFAMSPSLAVNATPLGLAGAPPMPSLPLADVAARARDAGRPPPLFLDTVYGAAETELARRARDAGWLASDGRRLLVAQARLSFEIWFGVEPGDPPPSFR